MKIINFRPQHTVGDRHYAVVTVVTWFGLCKKPRAIFRTREWWRWLDSGDFTPSNMVENMEMEYYAMLELPAHGIDIKEQS